ncbi:MAG: hypothetical protein NC408_04330 [Candidatus Gastranaerophilales bacterium]|nr:hypothetical protein [Candidatus Gastranaerophilales bacterium]
MTNNKSTIQEKMNKNKESILAFFVTNTDFYKTRELRGIYNQCIENKLIYSSTSFTAFLKFLKTNNVYTKKVELKFPSKTYTRYFVEEPNLYQTIQSISPNAYFSHYSAVEYHNLTNNLPKTIFINIEKSKPLKETPKKHLLQNEINKAFYMPARISQNLTTSGIYAINLLQSKYSGGLGILETTYNNAKIHVTDLERTLIDITVSPYYCGGCYEVLNVYKKAKGRVNAKKLHEMLVKLDYIYPFHQSIGFYMEKAGYKEADLQLFDYDKNLRFFIQRELKENERKYSERWNLFYPEFL